MKRDLPKMKQELREAKAQLEKKNINYYSRSFENQK